MIDTDKYEGHTPAPWQYYYSAKCDDWILKTERYIHSGKGARMKVGSPDQLLIADAPLLLEEVKRLRERLDLAEDYIKHDVWMEYAMQVLERDLGDEE